MKRSVFERLGGFAVRRRWTVVAVWAIALAVMGTFAKGLQARLTSGGFEVPNSDSLSVIDDLEHRFTGQFPATAYVVVTDPDATVDDAAFRAQVQAISDRMKSVEGTGGIDSYLNGKEQIFVSPDRHTTYVSVGLRGNQSAALDEAGAVAVAAREVQRPGFDIETGGQPAFYDRFNTVAREDLEKAEKIAFPITLLVLVIAFGTLVAAGLPILLGVFSLIVTLGGLYFLAGVTDMSVYVTNTASVIGIGVGIDYSLFVVTRFREERRRGENIADSVVRSVASSGRAVALSGATVIVALAGMFLVNIQAFRSMAIGSMSVVAVAVVAAVTLLPALLAIGGRWIDRLRLPIPQRADRADRGGFWHRWAIGIMRRPWAFLGVSLVVLLALALPFSAIRLGQPGPGVLPKDEQPRVATEQLSAAFGAGVTGPIEILVNTPGGAGTADNLRRVNGLVTQLASDPDVERVVSLTSILPFEAGVPVYADLYKGGVDGMDPRIKPFVTGLANWTRGADLSRIIVIGKNAPESAAAEALVQRIRDVYVYDAGLQGAVRVGGFTAFNFDLEQEIAKRMPVVVMTVLALSFLLLMMAFRSLLLPLKAILMNLLSVGAAYGVVVALFQWGWGASLFGFTSEHHVESFVPMFLFSILFGLSMDYEVFLMSRMKEEYERTGSNDLGVARGLEGTARTITSAALIMVTVFVSFALSRVVPFKEMGVGLAVAVIVDAAIIRTILVPAAMKLMGRWNWWMPSWLDRLLPRIALEQNDERRRPEPTTVTKEPVPAV